jgi:hypothetical protein
VLYYTDLINIYDTYAAFLESRLSRVTSVKIDIWSDERLRKNVVARQCVKRSKAIISWRAHNAGGQVIQ